MIKMIVMCIMPFFILIWKRMKNWMQIKWYNPTEDKKIEIEIDREYCMILSKLEIVFIFTIFCPLLYPVTLIAISVWIIFYENVIVKLKWKIRFKYVYQRRTAETFPFGFLMFGVLVQQALTLVLICFSMNSIIMALVMTTLYMTIDLSLIFRVWHNK